MPKDRIQELRERRRKVELGGGEERLAKQRQRGMTARERVGAFCDAGSFQEIGAFAEHRATHFGLADKCFPADGVVTGAGRVAGRLVHVASQDFTVGGGSVGEVHALKIVEMQKLALRTGTPFVFLADSGGARVQEGIDSLSGYAKVFHHNVLLSGSVPQISIVCGPCAGGAAYSPALTDFIIQTRGAQMFITGPSVIKQVTGEVVTMDQLGGPEAQMRYSGVVHFVAEDDADAVRIGQALLSYLPSNNLEDPPRLEPAGDLGPDPSLDAIVPDDPKQPYDVREVLSRVLDGGDLLEVQRAFAENIVIGFGRIDGRTVGVVASQPVALAGALDIDASDKAARFVRFCNGFNIPIVTFVDVPGFLPGVEQERGGIIRHGAKMLFAYSAATVPKITVILRKAYGGAYIAMCGRDLGADRVVAWPTAEIAVMGAEGAVEVVFRREIEGAPDKAARRRELIAEYRERFAAPYLAAARRLVDDIIAPSETRPYLAAALAALETKRELRPPKKHGLMPL
jgi:methylmalonyl-CoA carboxyltransferase large subunit